MTSEDAESVSNLAKSLEVDFERPQANGFLVYLHEIEEFARRSGLTDYFYVAERDSELVGYLMCYDNNALESLVEANVLNYEDGIVREVSKQERPYIFGDHIGVREDLTQGNIGRNLMETLFEDMREKGINRMYVGVLHSPVRNEASVSFVRSFGFEEVSEVSNSDGLIWGIYCRRQVL